MKTSNNIMKSIFKNDYFLGVYEKLILGKQMDYKEIEYIYCVSMLLIEEYYKTSFRILFEFSYSLILRISLKYNLMEALYYFAINYGLFPIAKVINRSVSRLDDIIIDGIIESYKVENHYKLLQQHHAISKILNSQSMYNSFIAPTSYGKSDLIYQDIKKNQYRNKIVGIIVPKKSLIWQVYRELIKKNFKGYRILYHDQMYKGHSRIICIFTQERALRFLSDNNIYFDKLYIDEAHSIFSDDNRSILLSRLIRINRQLNPNQEVLYLSPLIIDSSNLSINNINIQEQRIDFNIKEFDISFLSKESNKYVYDKYSNKLHSTDIEYYNKIDYIVKESLSKTLVYLSSPSGIEKFANQLIDNLHYTDDPEINQLVSLISRVIDPDYHMNDMLRKGVLYLHGQIPDLIKDFLEFKYKSLDGLKYLIANSVVLEGINFPFNSLFIVDSFRLNGNSLRNLMGRINRLNMVFNDKNPNLSLLFVPIHFVDNNRYNSNRHMKKVMELLSKEEIDKVQNPILDKAKYDSKNEDIIRLENKVVNNIKDNINDLEQILLEAGLNLIYKNFSNIKLTLIRKLNLHKDKTVFIEESLVEKIHTIFFEGFIYDDFKDKEVARLINISTVKFYDMYFETFYISSIKEKISKYLNYFKNIEKTNKSTIYIGYGFGETSVKSPLYPHGGNKVYIDIKYADRSKRVNVAVIKIKLEDDFISFYINRFAKILLDLNIISEEEYNEKFYGTSNKYLLELVKSGISPSLIKKLIEESLDKNLVFDENGQILLTEELRTFILKQDELTIFEFSRVVNIN